MPEEEIETTVSNLSSTDVEPVITTGSVYDKPDNDELSDAKPAKTNVSNTATGVQKEKISVSDVVINLNQVLQDSEKNAADDVQVAKETSAVSVNRTPGSNLSTAGGSILAKYINETRQRSALSTGSLQLQRNLHLLERNNVQITGKQGHMLNNSVSIYPSKPKSVDSPNVSQSTNNQGNSLGRMQGIVQNVGNQSSQGYRIAVPLQHFMSYQQRMVSPYSLPQHVQMRPGHLQLRERTIPPLLPFQNQMELRGFSQSQLQRLPVFQDRIMQMNIQNKMQQIPQLIPRMAVQMQYPQYYPVPNRFPNSPSPTSTRERPLSDPRSVNADRMSNLNLHQENFERYPRSYSEPHEDSTTINPNQYQQDVYHSNTFAPETFQREPNAAPNDIFYRPMAASSDSRIDLYQPRSSHDESGIRHTPEKKKEGSSSGHDGTKVVTKQEFIENVDEAALGDNVEEFVDFERAANLNMFTDQHEVRPQEETENYDEGMSIAHFLQVDYNDNPNDSMRQNDDQQDQEQEQRQEQPLYQMNRPKTIIFKCKYCKKKFFHKRELEKHMISHSTYAKVKNDGRRRDFPCTLCDCSYIRKTHLERHMLSHMKNQDQFKCEKCNYFFVHRKHLEIHNLQAHSENTVEENRYSDQLEMDSVDPNAADFEHGSEINIVKIKEELIENIDRPQKPFHKHSNVSRSFFCQHCGRAFLKNQYLRAHIRNFHDGNFSETTATQLSVNRPFNPYTQQKNLFCPVCGQGFIKMKYFRSHWNKFHEQDHETRTDPSQKTNPVPLSAPPPPLVKKPFVCHICNNGFYHPQNLKRHIRDVHYKKKLEMRDNQSVVSNPDGSPGDTTIDGSVGETSGTGSPSTPTVKKVSRGYRGSRAFCPVCSKEFLYEYNVRRHIKNVHPQFIGMAPVKIRPTPLSGTGDQDEEQDMEQQDQEQDQSITLSNLSEINESELMGWSMDDGNGQNPSTSQSNEERPFKCTLCNKKFLRLLFLKRHFTTSHGMSHPDTTEADWSFECRSCGKRFARNDSLVRHMKMKHRKLYRTIRAEKIRQNYASASNAEAQKITDESEPKTGDEQDDESQNAINRDDSETVQTEKDPFEGVHSQDSQEAAIIAPKLTIFRCGSCSSSFSTKLEYVRHQRTIHARQRKHKCKICHFKFAQFAHLRRHMNSVHAPKATGETKKCTKCAFTASNNIALSNHMRAHIREEASMDYNINQEQLEEGEDQDDQEFEIPNEDDIDSQVETEIGSHEYAGYEMSGHGQANRIERQNTNLKGNSRRSVRPVKRKLARGSRRSRAFCPICSKEFMYEYNVKRHIQNAHPDCIGMAPLKTRPEGSENQEIQQDEEHEETQDEENNQTEEMESQYEEIEDSHVDGGEMTAGFEESESQHEGEEDEEEAENILGDETDNQLGIEENVEADDETEYIIEEENGSPSEEEDEEIEVPIDEENQLINDEEIDEVTDDIDDLIEETDDQSQVEESSDNHDNLAETFNESLAKRLDEKLAETMANVLDENSEEIPCENSDD